MEATTQIVNTTEHEPKAFAYVYAVYGTIPEFMPQLIFRRDKHFKAVDKKIIKCPLCRGTFTTVEIGAKVTLYRHPKKADVRHHSSAHCQTCRNPVGIIYANVS